MRIKQLLQERGISNKDLAKAIGISEVGAGHIVNGISVPTGNNIIKIAKFLNVPCGALFDDYIPSSSVSTACPHCGHPLKIHIE